MRERTKRGQVYYADLRPVIGSEQGGIRPCVIIQNNTGNAHSPTIIVAPMTTQKKNSIPIHVEISKNDKKLKSGTIILLEQIRVIDKTRIKNFICNLSKETMGKVDKALKISLVLNKEERKEMENLADMIHIGNTDVSIKEYNGRRVVTFKDIDMVHERPEGTADRNFRENKDKFIKNEDYFYLVKSQNNEIRGLEIPNRGITVITEQGYLMLVKSFTDDLAWKVQRELVNSYFKTVKPLSQIEMMRLQLGMIDGLDSRVSVLENEMTIDYGQQRVLENAVNKTVIDVLGGKQSNAYKKISKKVFSECNHDLKNYFNVNVRANVPKKRFDEAVEYAKKWKPCTNTMMLICNHNAQMNL